MKDLISRLKQTTASTNSATESAVDEGMELARPVDAAPQKKEADAEEQKTKKTRRKKREASPGEEDGIIQRIRNFEMDDGPAAAMHVRLPEQIHSKMLALKMKKLSAQKITLFALMRLMEEPEIKNTIKQILNDME